ncbi:MAG: hypothetical protein ACFNLL_04540 [Bacteroides sp.]
MRVGRILLLGLFVSGLSMSAAFAQPADDRAVYADDADGYKRADKTTPANISYQTVNKTLPYYVAPSTVSHPNLLPPRDHVNLGAGDLKATWTWTENGTTHLGFTITGNKADIIVNSTGTANVEVVEVSPDCGNGEMSKIQIIGTGAPKLKVLSAELVTVGTITAAATTGTNVIPAAQSMKGFMYSTCDISKVNGKSVKLTLQSTEDNLPVADVLRKYSFTVNCVIYRHKNDGTYTIDGTNTVSLDHNSANKAFVDGATGSDFTVTIPAITAPDPVQNEDYVDVIFYLGGSEGRDGVASSISHRSDNPLTAGFTTANITSYPYDKTNDELFAMVRLTDKPKTGPIYHIPYNY